MIGRALDVLNAPGSTREEFQALFNSRNFGPGDMEELSPELWEELRLDSAEAEYDLWEEIKQKKKPKKRHKSLVDPQGYLRLPVLPLSRRDVPIEEIPRTS